MIHDYKGQLSPGDGVAVRVPGAAMLVLAGAGQVAATAELVALVRGAPESSGRRLARQLAARLGGDGSDDLPPFAVVADEATQLVVFVHGPVRVDIEGSESLSISGAQSATWVDRVVDTVVSAVRIGPSGPWVASDRDGLPLALREGVVPAGAMRLVTPSIVAAEPPTKATPAPAVFPPPVVVDIASADGPSDDVRPPLPVDTADAEPPTDDMELVEGILCSREHLSNPAAPYCSVCGISLVHRTHNVVLGPRPPLGVLVFDDGSTYSLDRGYVVGRQPDDDPQVRQGGSRPLVLDDPDRSVSRVHAEIVLDGWDVKVVDRGSTNGTFVFDADREQWRQLAPDAPFAVSPSTRLAFGNRTSVYESPHVAPGAIQIGRRVPKARGAA